MAERQAQLQVYVLGKCQMWNVVLLQVQQYMQLLEEI